MRWKMELEAEYSLTNHTLCEGCGLRDKRLRWWIVCVSAQTMCLYSQSTPGPQLLLQGIPMCEFWAVYPTAEVTEASSLAVAKLASTVLLRHESSGSVVRASD